MSLGKVYLIPTFLHEDAIETIPNYVLDAIKDCQIFFVENEKTARHFLKKLWKNIIIDDYQWFAIHKAEQEVKQQFIQFLKQKKNIGILSEAGCPGIADPGQILIDAAQQIHATIKPLVGPSSIILALMASGMNGQNFRFFGYLPIDNLERKNTIKNLEAESHKKNCTQIFIETPYRNNTMIKELLQTCQEETKLCIAVDITASSETILTKTIKNWKQSIPDIHKRLAIFLLHAS